MTTPDRFARLVEKKRRESDGYFIVNREITALLRREHAAVVRGVRKLGTQYTTDDGDSAAENLLADILAMLERRKS